MIKHIWFDMGGTLYQETAAFKKEHDTLRYKAYADIVNEPDMAKAKQGYDAMYTAYGSNSAVFTKLGKPSDYWQNIFDNLDLATVLIPDQTVKTTLMSLSRKVPISLFTNFKPQRIAEVCHLLTIDASIFTHILSGDDVKKRKPDVEGFEKMVQLSNLPAHDVLYVGDRIDVDIKPAHSIGIRTCLVWSSSDTADYSAPTFSSLEDMIRGALPSDK